MRPGVDAGPGAGGVYDVSLYNTFADASASNAFGQRGYRLLPGAGITLAVLPIARPVNGSEWLHGAALTGGGCYAIAGRPITLRRPATQSRLKRPWGTAMYIADFHSWERPAGT